MNKTFLQNCKDGYYDGPKIEFIKPYRSSIESDKIFKLNQKISLTWSSCNIKKKAKLFYELRSGGITGPVIKSGKIITNGLFNLKVSKKDPVEDFVIFAVLDAKKNIIGSLLLDIAP